MSEGRKESDFERNERMRIEASNREFKAKVKPVALQIMCALIQAGDFDDNNDKQLIVRSLDLATHFIFACQNIQLKEESP